MAENNSRPSPASASSAPEASVSEPSAKEEDGMETTKTYPKPVLPLMQSKSAEAQALLTKDWNELSTTEREAIHNEVKDVGSGRGYEQSSQTAAAQTQEQEDPQFVERCLRQMEQEIHHVRRLRSSYDRAMFLAPHRIKDKEFRLMFLRAEHFDTYRATQRFMKHFEYKNTLFGYEKLVETIRLDDLNEDDTESYLSGTFQVLSPTSASSSSSKKKHNVGDESAAAAAAAATATNGYKKKKEEDDDKDEKCTTNSSSSGGQQLRPVTWFAPHLGQFKSYQSMLRVLWYCFMSLVEDEDVQRTGIVHIQYNVLAKQQQEKGSTSAAAAVGDDGDDEESSPSPSPAAATPTSLFKDLCQHGPSFLDALPIRIVAVHHCYDVVKAQPDMDVYSVISRDLRCRIREHYGSASECLSQLINFGISSNLVPIAPKTGSLQFEQFMRYVDERETVEALSKERADKEHDGGGSKGDKILVPTRHDVLFGRGRPFQDHVGNKFLARLVDEHKAVYTSSENHDKTTISWLLVDKVKENNGRFLKRVENDQSGDTWWEEVSHDIARAKVTKSFRADMGKKPPKYTGT